MKIEAACYSEAFVPIYQPTRRLIPENDNLQRRCSEKLRSRIMLIDVPLFDLRANLKKNVMRVTESQSVRLTGHVACVGEYRNA